MRAEHPGDRVVLAFPDRETYRNLARRTAPPLQAAQIELWLVTESGEVAPFDHEPDTGAP